MAERSSEGRHDYPTDLRGGPRTRRARRPGGLTGPRVATGVDDPVAEPAVGCPMTALARADRAAPMVTRTASRRRVAESAATDGGGVDGAAGGRGARRAAVAWAIASCAACICSIAARCSGVSRDISCCDELVADSGVVQVEEDPDREQPADRLGFHRRAAEEGEEAEDDREDADEVAERPGVGRGRSRSPLPPRTR